MYNFASQVDFDQWLDQVPIKADMIAARLNLTVFDNDLDALQALSDWVLSNIDSVNTMKANPELWDELACYTGEMYKKVLGAQWAIELNPDNVDMMYFGKPIIVCDPPPPLCPMNSITTLIHRKKNSFLKESIEKRLRNKK